MRFSLITSAMVHIEVIFKMEVISFFIYKQKKKSEANLLCITKREGTKQIKVKKIGGFVY